MTSIWAISLPETVHMVFKERLLARIMFARSIKCLDGKSGRKIQVAGFFVKKVPIFQKYMSQCHFSGYCSSPKMFIWCLLAKQFFATSKKGLGWQLGAEESREHDSPINGAVFFEIQWTSDNPKGTVALSNHSRGL